MEPTDANMRVVVRFTRGDEEVHERALLELNPTEHGTRWMLTIPGAGSVHRWEIAAAQDEFPKALTEAMVRIGEWRRHHQ